MARTGAGCHSSQPMAGGLFQACPSISVRETTPAFPAPMQGDVAPLLTPEQLVKFDDLIAKQRARFQQFRRGFPQGPAPGEAPPGQGPPK